MRLSKIYHKISNSLLPEKKNLKMLDFNPSFPYFMSRKLHYRNNINHRTYKNIRKQLFCPFKFSQKKSFKGTPEKKDNHSILRD